MKRNKLFLLGLFVVFAAVLSLSLVSSTFAKYTSSSNGFDTARVARWGVTVVAEGNTAAVLDTNGGAAETHIVGNTGEILAPGTKGTFVSVNVEGTPEVAVEITYTATVNVTGWVIPTDTYYCPLVVKVNGTEVAAGANAAAFAANIKDAIEDLSKAEVAAGTPLTAEDLTITWEWAFEGDNAKDTELGQLPTLPSISIDVTCSVTQID